MKTATYRRGDGGLPARAAAFCLLALAVTLLQAREARAQWTSGGGTSSTADNVGIGTTTPAVPLQIRVPSGDVITRLSNAGGAAGALDLRYKFEFSQHRMGLTDGNGQWMFYTRYAPSNADSVGFFPGRVGVGTETPGYPLTVRANTNIAPLNLIGGTGSVEIWKDANPLPSKAVAFGSAIPGSPAGDDINLSTYNGSAWASRLTVVNATGNVGIGTTAPQQKLHVMGSIQAQGTNVNGDISVMSADPTKGYWDFYSSGVNGSMGFYDVLSVTLPLTIEKAAPSHSFYIKSNGNLGIGTNAPAAKLDVNGDIRVSGNINAKYQDVAEWVPSVQKLAAGTVVILDARHSNHVAASRSAYDTRVAGVISAQPGITLGEAGEGKVLVATTGRVKVKVDATRAPIQIGDLIVTSDDEGVAMKSEPIQFGGRQIHAPGTIVGKALEPLESGKGEILVLLSLQ